MKRRSRFAAAFDRGRWHTTACRAPAGVCWAGRIYVHRASERVVVVREVVYIYRTFARTNHIHTKLLSSLRTTYKAYIDNSKFEQLQERWLVASRSVRGGRDGVGG